MSDRGPDSVKEKIQATLDHFLSDSWSSDLSAVDTEKLIVFESRSDSPSLERLLSHQIYQLEIILTNIAFWPFDKSPLAIDVVLIVFLPRELAG